jgi:hypothetical protein
MKSPSEWLSSPRVGGLSRWLGRYHPFLTTILAVVLIAVFLPGRTNQTSTPETVGDLSATGPSAAEAAGPIESSAASATTAGGPSVAVNPNVLTFEEARKRGVELVANCDQSTGRIMVPTRFAPPCTQKFAGRNAGSTWQGVTDKEITLAYYMVEGDAATEAVLTAAGANDSPEQRMAQVRDWVTYFQAHYNLWGRKVKLVFVQQSGEATDDAAGKADAIKVATDIKAFASINGPNNTYVNELVARKVMCICTGSQPIETYIKWAPYVWTTLLASTQGYIHRAEYVGKRLKGDNARFAYDQINPTQGFKDKPRKFGFIYYDTDDYAYKQGAEFFIKYMKQRYGISFVAVSQMHGYPEVQRAQEEARPVIQKMKEAGATSLIVSVEPFQPIFLTQEATRQLYGPEWIITGSTLTDTAFFGRLYDQDQWSHAFGLSYLAARLPEDQSNAMRLYQWQFNREPPARAQYGFILAPISIMFNGIHLAGPSLTPETFRTGMYNQPIAGKGGLTTIAQSYGDKGIWPWKEDPITYDDVTEIWWDRNASGEDERGIDGNGLYRYVDGGKRYFPGEWPSTRPKAFDPKGTVTIYQKPPAADQWPCYPSPATKKKDRC